MNVEQITWLRRASGAKIPLPLDLLPDPPAENGKQPSKKEITEFKKKAQAEDLARDDIRRQLAEQQREEEARKQFMISNALRVIEPLKPALQEAFDIGYSGTQQKKVLGIKYESKDKRDFIAKNGDLTESGDTSEMRNAKLTKGGKEVEGPASEKLLKDVDRAYSVLVQLKKEMEDEMVERMVPNKEGTALEKGPASKLFTRNEIISEVFDPLVRSKILPDTFISDGYSRTQAMLDATNELYKKDLLDPNNFVSRGAADLGKGLVDMASGFAKCVLEATGHGGLRVDDALAGATALAKLSIDAADTIDTAVNHRALNKDDIIKLLDQIPSIAGQAVGAATNSKDLQVVVTSSSKAAELLVTAAMKRDYDSASSALTQFLGEVGKSVFAGLKVHGQDDTEQNKQTLGKDAGFDLWESLMKAGAPKVAKLVVQGKFSAVRGEMARMCLEAASKVAGIISDVQELRGAKNDDVTGMADGLTRGKDHNSQYLDDDSMSDLTDEEQKEIKEKRELEKAHNDDTQEEQDEYANESKDEMQKALGELGEEGKEKGERPKTAAEQRLAELKKKFEQDNDRQTLAEVQQDADAELEDFKARLRGDDKVSRAQHTVEKMIADLKRDEAILATLVAIGSSGAAIAGNFVAYAAIGTEAIKLAANAKLAYEKARATYEFVQEQKGARETANRYGSSIDNFLANAKFQLTRASINAALNGMKLIVAAVAAAVPHAAPAVPAAAALSAGVDAAMGGIKQARLKKSWTETKKALANPKNRRLGLKARKMNPTLAKYTIAYGATEEEDPIAVSMALACDLTEETLKNPGTNTEKVKKYLEAKFPDDGTVVGYWEDEKDWKKDLPEPALTPLALGKLYATVARAFPDASAAPPGPLAATLMTVSKPMPPNPTPEDWLKRSVLLKFLDDAFQDAGSEMTKHANSPQVAQAFAAFADLAAESAFEAWAAAQPPAPPKPNP